MNYFDIAILCVMALFLVIGVFKGFVKTFLGILSWGISLLIIYFLGDNISTWLAGTPIGDMIANGFAGLYGNMGDFATWTVGVNAEGTFIVAETGILLSEAMADASIPGFIVTLLTSNLTAGTTIASALGQTSAKYACYAIAAVAIMIAMAIVFCIIGIIVKKMMRKDANHGISLVNRGIGGLLYLGVGICVVSIAMIVIDVMEPLPFMDKVLEMRDAGKISSLFADKNPLVLIFKAITKS